MASLFPREEHAEALFHRILSNPGAEQQLYETFCMEQENAVALINKTDLVKDPAAWRGAASGHGADDCAMQ